MKTLLIILLIILTPSQSGGLRYRALSRNENPIGQNRKDYMYNVAESDMDREIIREEFVPNYEYPFADPNPAYQIKSSKIGSQPFKRNSNIRQTAQTIFNNKGETDSFMNETQKDTNTTNMLNLSPPMGQINETDELEDLKIILNQIYEELETIKSEKMCMNTDLDGNDCDMNGTWNSAEIGLRIELSTSAAMDGNKLLVNLAEKIPKKPSYRIDTTWVCSGSRVHKYSGPFYFHCTNHQSPQSMTIFHGICKRCGGFDTIFGEWIFQNIPSDCRQLWTFSETKRDVFHKNVINHLKFSNNDNVGNNQTKLNSLNKNNETINSKTAKFRRSIKNHVRYQDLFHENLN